MMNFIGRGTTPTFNFFVPFNENQVSAMYVTFAQGGSTVKEFDEDDVTWDENQVIVSLAQDETLDFVSTSYAQVQIRAKLQDGTCLRSEIADIEIGDLLKDGEI